MRLGKLHFELSEFRNFYLVKFSRTDEKVKFVLFFQYDIDFND